MVTLRRIPLPPTLNQAYPTNRWTGGRFKSQEFKLWERQFNQWTFLENLSVSEARGEFSKPVAEHVIHLTAIFYFEWSRLIGLKGKPKRNDVDNRLKALLDAIAKSLWIDDTLFFRISIEKYPVLTPYVDFVDVSLEWVKPEWMK